ncbi:YafY family protein [Nocardiopsis sp. MG754419]|uniref:helix-turn-helix transcriptional regulator n=1 Tax=Nocardiopsis sp. MG754419 TaxID=2259865 RepID=UPI001BA78017|nr:WYL domain-containing protein [Nocardiopsis sp. MG754419]MBR8742091.1 transcriptional regulator [Nocardiopsis sp. MG754419]
MVKTSGRLLTMLSLLQSRRDWPGEELAARLGVSSRTVRRDVDRLRELGYPITTFKGPDGGYRLDAGTRMPPLLFDDDQAIATAVALGSATATGAEIGEGAARALATLRQVMPARLRRRLDTLRPSVVDPSDATTSRPDGDLLSTIGAAVHAREELRFDYGRGPDTEREQEGPPVAPRRVQPHHLVTWRGRWYLVAWEDAREDWRVLRVDRIALRGLHGPRFTPRELPGGDVAAFVTGRFRGSAQGTAWPCEGEVVLSLPAAAVAPFAGDGVVEEVDAGRCRLFLGSWSWIGLASALGRFDADFDVIGPPELDDACAHLARRYHRRGRTTVESDVPAADET